MNKTIEEQLVELRDETEKDKCVDLNDMVFNYGKFHNNFVNQLIHLIFVPLILYTWYIMMCDLGPTFELGLDIPFFGAKIGFGVVPYFVVSTAYFFVDWKVGLVVSAWWYPIMMLGNYTWLVSGDELYWGMSQFWFMNLVNIVSWLAQIVGHIVFEERAPAFVTNLGFATLAPFFITFEVMNSVFGFKEGENMRKLHSLIE